MNTRLGVREHLGALIRRPLLAWEALRVAVASRRRRRLWVSSAYLRWRAYTAYGDPNAAIRTDDLVHYLMWRRAMRRIIQWENAS